MLIMNASVLARDDEHFAQGAFCPGHPVATNVPVFPKGFANDFPRVRFATTKRRRKLSLNITCRQLLPRRGNSCRALRKNLPVCGKVKAAGRLQPRRLFDSTTDRPKATYQWNSDRMICGA
jgi:hypothetical protein